MYKVKIYIYLLLCAGSKYNIYICVYSYIMYVCSAAARMCQPIYIAAQIISSLLCNWKNKSQLNLPIHLSAFAWPIFTASADT